jgi:hypothetical protein
VMGQCYAAPMTPKRQSLLERVASLPEDLLDEVEQSVEDIVVWHRGMYRLNDVERAGRAKGHGGSQARRFGSRRRDGRLLPAPSKMKVRFARPAQADIKGPCRDCHVV